MGFLTTFWSADTAHDPGPPPAIPVTEVDDLSFIVEADELVRGLYESYLAGNLDLSNELAAALAQTDEQLAAIRVDGPSHQTLADQRAVACARIAEMLQGFPPAPEPLPVAQAQPAIPTAELTPRPLSPEEPPAPRVARSAIFLAAGVIAFNIVVQAATYGLERSARVQPDTAIAVGLGVGLAFYVIVALVAVRSRAATSQRTAWSFGDPQAALIRGLVVGFVASVVVLGLQSLVTHQLVGDPTVQMVVSGGSLWRIVAAFVVFVGAAPLVEEYIFRGVLAESLRGRGARTAIGVSAVLFSLAHLRPAGLIYYALIGIILGRLYFRYGLKASIAAHAMFNGLLVAAALASVVGPSQTFVDGGAALHLPAAWKSASPAPGTPYRFAFRGPSGSAILVADTPIPAGTTFNPAAVDAAVRAHQLPIPPGETVTSATTAYYPAGPAALLDFSAQGHAGRLVIMVRDNRQWLFVLSTAGSSKAMADFNHMMEQLTLP